MTQLPPHNTDAERGVLAGILRDPDTLSEARVLIDAGAFYLDQHQRTFAAIEDAARRGPVDLVTVADSLRTARHFADVGGMEFLTDLYGIAATGANVSYHAGLVRDAATRRALIHAAREIDRDATAGAVPADELLATAERKLFDLRDSGRTPNDLRNAKQLMQDAYARIDERFRAGAGMVGLPVGYPDLDNYLGGLRPGQLVILAARPGGGKTALALNIAANVSSGGIPTLFFSMEMPCEELADRLLAMGSGISASRIGKGRLTTADLEQLAGPGGDGGASTLPLWVDDNPSQSGDTLLAVTRRAVRKLGIGFVVVDYLQLLKPENPRENRTQQVGLMARRVWGIARECKLPVLCLCQLNRQVDVFGEKPKLSHLRESGEIEQHAHKVLLLSPAENSDPQSEVWQIVCDVAKNRNGPTGELTLNYRRPVLRFENYSPNS